MSLGIAIEGDTPDEGGWMICSECGERVYDDGSDVCPECGETLRYGDE